MINPQKISEYLRLFQEITLEDLTTLFQLSRAIQLPAGTTYIRENSRLRKLAYIKSGLIRACSVTENGTELTVLLRWEDQFFASYDSILFNQPSRFSYVAMEDTELLEADYDRFMAVLNQTPKFNKAKDYFFLNMLAETLKQSESFILYNPEERYLQLIKDKPDIVQRLADKHLATYLGITPVSLSRIRKRLALRHDH